MKPVEIARNGDGKVRVDYDEGGSRATVLFEPVAGGVLESRFDSAGSMTDQRLLENDDATAAARDLISGMRAEAVEGGYRDVLLQKACPKCGSTPLTRYMDTVPRATEAPIMPLYVCGRCKTRGYYLTEEYLEKLVSGNRQLFEGSELSELDRDSAAFMQELRAYIIRIFASQRIMQIK